eukprot:COSAG04_NODE_6525_length_1310_cov_0.964492_1_plen_207_part_10
MAQRGVMLPPTVKQEATAHLAAMMSPPAPAPAASAAPAGVRVKRELPVGALGLVADVDMAAAGLVTGDRKRDQFVATLYKMHDAAGTPIVKIPLVAKVPLDLYSLHQLVQKHGGFAQVVKEKLWKPIAVELGISLKVCTDYGFRLRNHYERFLLILEEPAALTEAAPPPAKRAPAEAAAAPPPPKRARAAEAAAAAASLPPSAVVAQ